MNDKKEVQVVNGFPPINKTSKYQRLKQAVAVGATYALATSSAYAGEMDTIWQSLSGEISGAKAALIALFAGIAIVLSVFVGWKYLKRAANAA